MAQITGRTHSLRPQGVDNYLCWRSKTLVGETKGTNMEKGMSQVRVNRRKAQQTEVNKKASGRRKYEF